MSTLAMLVGLAVSLLPATGLTAELERPVRIGVLTVSWGPPPAVQGLVEGLVALGYHENVDFVIGVRFTRGDASALPAAAKDMVAEGLDLFFAVGVSEAKAAQQATTAIPIVFHGSSDPIGEGLVESYARPGGNVTGIIDYEVASGGKRLQLFKELIPGLTRVLFPYNKNNQNDVTQAAIYYAAARRLDLELVELPLGTLDEAQVAMAEISKEDIDGILSPPDADLNIIGLIIETTDIKGIPSMFPASFYSRTGGVASYGTDQRLNGQMAARLMHKIIRGIDPAEIPVEVDPYLEFVVNLKVADKLGIAIPRDVLFQADRIIR